MTNIFFEHFKYYQCTRITSTNRSIELHASKHDPVTNFCLDNFLPNRIQTRLPPLPRYLPAQKLRPSLQNLLKIIEFSLTFSLIQTAFLLLLPLVLNRGGAVNPPSDRGENPSEQRQDPGVRQHGVRFQRGAGAREDSTSFFRRQLDRFALPHPNHEVGFPDLELLIGR